MAYSRFGEFDVYLWPGPKGYHCSSCKLTDKESYTIHPKDSKHVDEKIESEKHQDVIMDNPTEAFKHLRKHLIEGHEVPNKAFSRLKYEINNMQE